MSIHPEGMSCSDVGRVLVLNVPPAGCLDPILTIAAAMSGRPLFVSPKDAKKEADAAKMRMVGTDGLCSPRLSMSFHSRNEGSKRVL